MKVLLVNTGMFPVPPQKGGGIEAHTYYLARSLADYGCEVHYVTDVTSKAQFNRNIIVCKIYAPRLSFQVGFHGWVFNYMIGGAFSFKSALLSLFRRKFDFDIVHVHGNLSGLLISMIRPRLPLLFTVHNPTPWMYKYGSHYQQKFREMAYKLIDIKLTQRADHIITISKSLKNELVLKWSIPERKITLIPNGIDVNIFRPNIPSANDIRVKYDIDSEYCLFVGQLRSRKGVDVLLKALSCLNDVDIVCVIVGDGPERKHLTELANKLQVSDKVVFLGAVPFEDLLKVYASATFFVLPTLAEGLPLAILEAISSGLPVISTNVSDIPDVVREGYNGFIVPPLDDVALCERIKLLVENRNLRKRMAENARQTAIKRFSWSLIAKETMAVYERIISAREGVK